MSQGRRYRADHLFRTKTGLERREVDTAFEVVLVSRRWHWKDGQRGALP
jgi:hypothetical protein